MVQFDHVTLFSERIIIYVYCNYPVGFEPEKSPWQDSVPGPLTVRPQSLTDIQGVLTPSQ